MDINKNDTAVLVTDPQNDFLSEQGVTWQLFGNLRYVAAGYSK